MLGTIAWSFCSSIVTATSASCLFPAMLIELGISLLDFYVHFLIFEFTGP